MRARAILLTLGVAAATADICDAEEVHTSTTADLLSVQLQWSAKAGCSASSDGHTFSLPAQTSALHDFFAGLATQKYAISLSGDVHYECVDQVLAAARKSGIPRLGFISEPPTPSPR